MRARALLAASIASTAVAASLALATVAPSPAPAADAPPLPPQELTVYGGEERWHEGRGFELRWRLPLPTSHPIVAVHYRALDAAGAPRVPEARIASTERVDLRVPWPGEYTAEVWLEDSAGQLGPAATAKLRFDDARPGPVAPLPVEEWIGRRELPYPVRLTHPAAPLPVSGVRGYAVSVDRFPHGEPCASARRCEDAETDLRGGIADDVIRVGDLPEGTSYVHAVAVSGSGVRSATVGSTRLRVDTTSPTTSLAGVPTGWSKKPVTLVATASDALSGMAPDGPGGPFTAIQVDDGVPKLAAGDSVRMAIIAQGVHRVAYYARDAAGNVDDGALINDERNPAPATAVVRIDREPPSVAFLNSQNPLDPDLIVARVADPLSGPSTARGQIAVRPRGSHERFEALPTEVAGGDLRARWESDAYAPGEYEFRAVAYDAAGNAATASARSDGAPMVLSSPLKPPTALRAGLAAPVSASSRCAGPTGHRRCRRLTILPSGRRAGVVSYGRGSRLNGRLFGPDGSPLAGMPIEVEERFDPGASPALRRTAVLTGPNGAFTVPLAPGPSRTVTATFRGTRVRAWASSHPIRLGVRSGVRMRASATVARVGGAPVVFRGRVLGAGTAVPAAPRWVQLQFRVAGLPWSEFRTVQTDRRGRFRYGYRFEDDDSRGARFQFRAVVPAQSDWPYEPGASRPVAVWGR